MFSVSWMSSAMLFNPSMSAPMVSREGSFGKPPTTMATGWSARPPKAAVNLFSTSFMRSSLLISFSMPVMTWIRW